MNLFQRSAAVFNRAVIPLLGVPVVRSLTKGSLTVLEYTGRKSGKRIAVPVGYRRSGNALIVGVSMPDKKGWWRNFTGDGGPVSLDVDGESRTGHAVSSRDAKGAVQVRINLDGPSGS